MAQSCGTCGKTLDARNGIKVRGTFSQGGYHCECRDCAGKRFAMLCQVFGSGREAMYVMCASMDIPFLPEKVKKKRSLPDMFIRYLETADTTAGFAGTRARGTIEIDLPNLGTAAKDEKAEKTQKETWLDKWGNGLSDAEYEELDRKYEVESHEFKGNLTPRIEKNLIALSKLDVEFDRAMREGDFDKANRITDIIKKTRDMESLRASDDKPTEEMRVDAIVDALERRGAMTDGTLLSREELLQWIAESTRTHYSTSLDIIDAVMLVSENARRRTEGERVLSSLPGYLQVEDKYGELEIGMTEQERDVMKELGRLPPRREH